MNIGAAERALAIGAHLTGMFATTAASAADEIRDGKRQFTTEMPIRGMSNARSTKWGVVAALSPRR